VHSEVLDEEQGEEEEMGEELVWVVEA